MSSISIFNLIEIMNRDKVNNRKKRNGKRHIAKFVRLNTNATIPTKASEESAGYDLYACIDSGVVQINPHETVFVDTGLAITPPKNYYGAIFARSGLASKQGLRPANCVGICDEDYTGNYMVALHNDSDETRYINNGDRIAQLVFMPYLNIDFVEVDKLKETERGGGGFGSTGN